MTLQQAIGLGSDFFEPAPQEAAHELCRVLMAGRMIYWKGFEAGITAVTKVLDENIDIELTVLGTGDKNHMERLKRLAGKYLDTRIRFIDSVDHENMKAFYERFDVLLNCSLRDSGCLVVMEAMSRGVPVICIDTGGPKVNTSSECAIKIQPAAYGTLVEAISGAISAVAMNPHTRTLLSRAAYVYAKKNFNIEGKVKDFLENYA